MTTVVYTCPFVPAEWIAAHGLTPCRVMPSPADVVVGVETGPGWCPYAKAFLYHARAGCGDGAVIFTTACDQMRRVSEFVADGSAGRAVFLMHVPTTWETSSAHRLYRSELERLGRLLESLGGRRPTPELLAETMIEYDDRRRRLRNAHGQCSARRFSEAIARLHRSNEFEIESIEDKGKMRGIAVALVGGPMLPNRFSLFDRVEEAGGEVVLDATATGELTLPRAFDRRRMREEPFEELADAYFGHIPEAFRRPNTKLYQWLKAALDERGVRGILFRSYIWCDTWHAEAQRMKEWSPVPVLTLNAENDHIDGRTASRVQAFLEIL